MYLYVQCRYIIVRTTDGVVARGLRMRLVIVREDEFGTLSTVCSDEFRCQFVDVGALYLYIYCE